ncbi:3-phosphoshikimate 1-carboxyvinyltransferase [Myroides odoratimimus]|uniref:3-phosphoshikimate 1-carboxyvinyltransferase n=4 Tax=Myroides TaxID=76831 RepID=A0A0S7EC89_9FLAO|nr:MULTISPECIES: 3-phosphoshikimate 1-carboxyvinyltransferase [Myroides]AJA69022.1 3-phosphoshikimate 1-carboxyvinyltransferase [Myroides sp. A21]AJH13874.1 5-enolpyruvylshikimate-3-phosphate synthase [Myroides profundi]ALU26264.1 3-phosphoshikimate 1-carboxyvinyltransferase [Myroides odoratimimus]APA92316.1 3-phosphoshikimate 1-carboxyvinyltransferase [Myroides sp. ZB35]EHO12260.1 3-phosphoshikimate 1-carboxyvinyltransferase [Myroides odoratimimus CCUG 10230]
MNIKLLKSKVEHDKTLVISGSKSESNRLLILQELFPSLTIGNVSDSDDVCAMQGALASTGDVVDIHHAGTTMRFLTAYYSLCSTRELTLTGSSRMQERPIGVLVEALRQLGADITYSKKEGYPPLHIKGQIAIGGKVELPADVSSQYITALLLVGTRLKNGIELHLVGNITSRPYIEMTLQLLSQLGVESSFNGNIISVKPLVKASTEQFTVESDWSSASYFYSFVALSPIGTTMQLKSYKEDSLQGDSQVSQLYTILGVETTYLEDYTIKLEKVRETDFEFKADLIETPDLAQTIAVTCFGLGIRCEMTGLHTLKIKETDRLVALQNELTKLGGVVDITEESIVVHPSKGMREGIEIETYQDHRMAMAFAPLSLKGEVTILEAEVVTKSFINYWDCLAEIGVNIVKK